jgi:hypothetical protein
MSNETQNVMVNFERVLLHEKYKKNERISM